MSQFLLPELMKQAPYLIWLTGLSGSGKSTLALQLKDFLEGKKFKLCLLDGDDLRKGLNKDLGYSAKDREENLRRVAEVARLMLDAGLIVICAFISPCEQDRQAIRNMVGRQRFFLIHVNCTVEKCEERDVKGLYARARKGLIPDFTGISAPYEHPALPGLVVYTAEETVEESLNKIIRVVQPLLISE